MIETASRASRPSFYSAVSIQPPPENDIVVEKNNRLPRRNRSLRIVENNRQFITADKGRNRRLRFMVVPDLRGTAQPSIAGLARDAVAQQVDLIGG